MCVVPDGLVTNGSKPSGVAEAATGLSDAIEVAILAGGCRCGRLPRRQRYAPLRQILARSRSSVSILVGMHDTVSPFPAALRRKVREGRREKGQSRLPHVKNGRVHEGKK